MGVLVGEGMHHGAWTARSVAMLDALTPFEPAAICRVQAPIRGCVHFTSSLY